MKQLIYIFAFLVALSANASTTSQGSNLNDAKALSDINGYTNSFIFNEAGIEFSVFPDGQFDFYMPNHARNINFRGQRSNIAFSFNTGYNYNPFVQYDSFGAIIQIENIPVFYDAFGRVNQIGDIIINYNGFGRVRQIGGLQIYYRNNVIWRHQGIINRYNRAYVWRPWHNYYATPAANYCVINTVPYRQFYSPIRYTWYRPYHNNTRRFNIRRGRVTRSNYNNTVSRRYAQNPRNAKERNIERRIASRKNRNSNTRITRRNSITNRTARTTVARGTTNTSNRYTTNRPKSAIDNKRYATRNRSIAQRSVTNRNFSKKNVTSTQSRVSYKKSSRNNVNTRATKRKSQRITNNNSISYRKSTARSGNTSQPKRINSRSNSGNRKRK